MKIDVGGRLLADPLCRTRHKRFDDMDSRLEHDPTRMRWPSESEGRGAVFCGNNDYIDLRGANWDTARLVRAREGIVIEAWERLGGYAARKKQLPMVEDFMRLSGGLDLGMVSAVFAIAAAGGVPVSSCNGGAFGGTHLSNSPGLAFWWRTSAIDTLLECIEAAGMSTWMYNYGAITVGGDYIRRYLLLADALHERRDRLGAATTWTG